MCFRDRTFCNDPVCKGACGSRPWTPELQAEAERWWGEGLPPVSFVLHERQAAENASHEDKESTADEGLNINPISQNAKSKD